MSEPIPKRHWFRFSLRTLFVVVLAFIISAAWLGRQVNIVRTRSSILERIAGPNADIWRNNVMNAPIDEPHRIRVWFGDFSVIEIALRPGSFNSKEVQEIRQAFPESKVSLNKEYFEKQDRWDRWKPGDPLP